MADLPAPLRAALGLVASVTDAVKEGRSLPDLVTDRALELPVLAVSTVLQLSLRAQQQYLALTVRGDEFLMQMRGGAPEDPPSWAQFDDDSATTAPSAAPAPSTAAPAGPQPAARKAPPKKTAPAKKAAATKAPSNKKVSPPRIGKPSAFDLIEADIESDGE